MDRKRTTDQADLWNALGGNDDDANAERAERACNPCRALLRELGEES